MKVNDIFPYNEMTIQTEPTVGQCVKIPKIYVENSADENGLITRKISKNKNENYHCHPAFMHNGQERDGILIACDIVQGEPVTLDKAKEITSGISETTQKATGNTYGTWQSTPALTNNTKNEIHLYNIYEHHLIALLMLIEYGTTNIKAAMRLEETATTGNYRGIVQHWGDIDLWCDGLQLNPKGTLNPYIHIYDNKGNFELTQTTAYRIIGTKYPITTSNEKGENWDLSDVFFEKETTTNKTDGSFGATQIIKSQNYRYMLISDTFTDKTDQNPFSLKIVLNTATANYRLAKFI